MTLAVNRLNADSTFLLNFTPDFAPSHVASGFPGSFSILIDPWVVGHSSLVSPIFQVSHHTTLPSVQSLQDIEQPNLILISQDKPDHCHKETLCTLPKDTRVRILATPAAAKKIRSWKYFTHASIESMVPYSSKKEDSVLRIPIPGYSVRSAPGEVTVAYIPQKRDVTALHNAIGITYRAPGTTTTKASGSVVDLPLSPPDSACSLWPTLSSTPSSKAQTLPTPPASPLDANHGFVERPVKAREQTLSILYSPHGVSQSVVNPYASSHLAKEGALPLTALFHAINEERNPWFMGGNVCVGYPGGEQIVRQLGARYWISAHDEVKDNRGLSVAWVKSTQHSVEHAQSRLDSALKSEHDPAIRTEMINMDNGDSLRIVES